MRRRSLIESIDQLLEELDADPTVIFGRDPMPNRGTPVTSIWDALVGYPSVSPGLGRGRKPQSSDV